jgi:hypothetical protein
VEVKQISNDWWVLRSYGENESDGLTWFGYSKDEVLGKFRAYLRKLELRKWRRPDEELQVRPGQLDGFGKTANMRKLRREW